jgi:hypothetical protein
MIGKKAVLIIGLCAVSVLTFLWFASLPAGILMGDDLRMVYAAQHGGYASSPMQGFVHAELGTYRPLLTLLFSLIVPLFGTNFALYQALNTFVELGSAFVISVIAFRVSRENVVVTLSIVIAFVFSRFAYYAIGQVFGVMEGLALFLTLLLVSDVVSAYRQNKYAPLLRGTLWFGLALFTDERYVVALPFILLAIVLFPGRIEHQRLWAIQLSVLPIALVALNVATKTFIFHTYFLQASGSHYTSTHPFNPDVMLHFAYAGLLNVIGFNVGPAYLSAQDIADVGPAGYFLALFIAVPFCIAILALSQTAFQMRLPREQQYYVLLWLTLFVPLLMSACVSFRQEFRWLYASYTIALLGLAAATGYFADYRRVISVCSVCFVAGTIASAVLYRTYIDNIYFFYSERIAEQVARIVEKRRDDAVVVVTNSQPTINNWIFMNSEFFEEYRLGKGRVFYLNAVADIPQLGLPPTSPPPSIVDINGTAVAEIEPKALRSTVVSRYETTLLSLTAAYSRGVINSLAPASTPNGRGVFINAWPSDAGSVTSLTVLATYRYLYPKIRIVRHERLTFTSAAPYAIGEGAHAFIDVKYGPTDARLYDEFLPAASVSGPRWEQHEIALDGFAGKTVAIIFGADIRDNDPTAAWVAFGNPALVRMADAGK